MKWIERQVESDEKPEVPLAERLVKHFAGGLGEPVVDAGKERKQQCQQEGEVEMRHNEVGIRELPIERRRRQHDSGNPANRN